MIILFPVAIYLPAATKLHKYKQITKHTEPDGA
jgi:hypothetical protein